MAVTMKLLNQERRLPSLFLLLFSPLLFISSPFETQRGTRVHTRFGIQTDVTFDNKPEKNLQLWPKMSNFAYQTWTKNAKELIKLTKTWSGMMSKQDLFPDLLGIWMKSAHQARGTVRVAVTTVVTPILSRCSIAAPPQFYVEKGETIGGCVFYNQSISSGSPLSLFKVAPMWSAWVVCQAWLFGGWWWLVWSSNQGGQVRQPLYPDNPKFKGQAQSIHRPLK